MTAADAQHSLSAIDEAIGKVSSILGDLSAVQNRFESTLSNLGNAYENIASSNSRVEDADYASEMSDLVKNRILQQAGVAVQSQANQSAGTIYSLLKG